MIGFSGTGADQFLSAYAVLGESVAGETIFGTPILLKQGSGSIDHLDVLGRALVSEAGATVVDPDDPHSFWNFQDFGAGNGTYGVQITQLFAVPEPSTALLLTSGLLALGVMRRERV